MSVVRLSTPLRPYANGQTEVQLRGQTVEQAMRYLIEYYPSLKKHLYADDGNLRPYVHLFLNDEDIQQLQGMQTPLQEADRMMIVPSIAGG
ncbi:MAG: MoaD/ThiS family protein [Anaerolineaceae bacterium]|nr:MoaD/ThiS family protein [Anaerolineaceae bacterium]